MDIKKLLDPASTAVLVVDKQGGYFNPDLVQERHQKLPAESAEILAKIDDFIDQARSAHVEVIWTQMIEDIEESAPTIAELIRHDPDGVSTITKPGSPSFEIYGRTVPEPSEKVVTKYYYNAFSKTDLATYLKSKGISTLILVGGYASRCVLSTAVGANGEDIFSVVPPGLVINQEATAYEIEAVYEIINAIFGVTVSVDDILSAWNS